MLGCVDRMLLVALAGLVLNAPLAADNLVLPDPIKVVSPALSYWSDDRSDSSLSVAFQRVMRLTATPMSLTFEPLNRGYHDFFAKKFDCALGGDAKIIKLFFGVEVLETDRFLLLQLRVFNLPPQKPISSRAQLASLRLGANGIAKEKFLPLFGIEVAELDVADDIGQNVEKLKRGRVDAVVMAWPKSFLLTQDLQFDPQFSLYEWNESVICHPTPENRAFIQRFNQALRTAQEKGIIPADKPEAWLRWKPEYSDEY